MHTPTYTQSPWNSNLNTDLVYQSNDHLSTSYDPRFKSSPLKVSLLPNLSWYQNRPCFFGVLDKIAALRYVHILILKAFHNAILFAVRDYKHCYTPIQAGAIQSDQKPFLDYREPERWQPERSWTSFVVLEAPRPGNAVSHKDEKRQSSKASICATVSRGHCQTDIFIMGQCDPRQASDRQTWKAVVKFMVICYPSIDRERPKRSQGLGLDGGVLS